MNTHPMRSRVIVMVIGQPQASPGIASVLGYYLKSIDFQARDGDGEIHFTKDWTQAMSFASPGEANAFIGQVSPVKPQGNDGAPYQPLFAFLWQGWHVSQLWDGEVMACQGSA